MYPRLLFSLCILLSSASHYLLAQLIQPVRTLELPQITSDPIINGQSNEADYSGPQTTDLFNPEGWTGPEDFTAQFKLMWGYSYLYFYGNVTDDMDHHYHWGYDNPRGFDNCEIYIDLDTNTIDSTYRENSTIMLRFCRGLDSVETPGRAARSDYDYYYINNSDGWIFEAAIPWTCVMERGSLPEDIMDYIVNNIGFDVLFTDSDNSDGDPAIGNPDAQVAWDLDNPDTPDDRTEDLAIVSTRVFGNISTVGCACDYIKTEQALSVDLYPNPCTDFLNVSFYLGYLKLKVLNIEGQLVHEQAIEGPIRMNTSHLSPGIYMILLDNRPAGKFIKQ